MLYKLIYLNPWYLPPHQIAIARSSVTSYILSLLPFFLIASLKFRTHQGQAVTIASAPVSSASLILSIAVHIENSWFESLTPPPAPQHQAYSFVLSISTSLIPGILLRTSREG